MLDGRVEVITGRERRRRWSTAVKLRIVAEAVEPGVRLADVARRHEVSRGLLWQWCAQVRRGELRPEAPALFVPVRMEAASVPATVLVEGTPASRSTVPPRPDMDQVEVELPDGSRLRVGPGVSLVALRRVLAALRR